VYNPTITYTSTTYVPFHDSYNTYEQSTSDELDQAIRERVNLELLGKVLKQMSVEGSLAQRIIGGDILDNDDFDKNSGLDFGMHSVAHAVDDWIRRLGSGGVTYFGNGFSETIIQTKTLASAQRLKVWADDLGLECWITWRGEHVENVEDDD
jgi:hypothetical protein